MTKAEEILELKKQLIDKQTVVEVLTKESETLHIKLNVAKEALRLISQFTSEDIEKLEDQAFIAASALFKINS